MRLLMPYNFASWTNDLWPLDLRPFWIIWKPVKILLLLGFSSKVHRNFYTWTLDIDRQIMVMKIILILKMEFLWTNENCSFRQIIILSQHMHKIWHNGRGSWKMVNNQSSQSLVKWWRYSTQLKIKLQTGIAQSLFDRQPCNFHPHMRLLMPHNFAIWTYDLWPLDFPPFWIIGKTV